MHPFTSAAPAHAVVCVQQIRFINHSCYHSHIFCTPSGVEPSCKAASQAWALKALAAIKFPQTLNEPICKPTANGVIALVAQDCARQQHANGQWQAHQPRAAQCPGDKQQRIAGQKRHHHHAGFSEHNEKQQQIHPRAIRAYKDLQVFVDVQNEVE